MNAFAPAVVLKRHDPLSEFHAARAAMLKAWSAWIGTKPPPDDIGQELFGTVSALRQINTLAGNDA